MCFDLLGDPFRQLCDDVRLRVALVQEDDAGVVSDVANRAANRLIDGLHAQVLVMLLCRCRKWDMVSKTWFGGGTGVTVSCFSPSLHDRIESSYLRGVLGWRRKGKGLVTRENLWPVRLFGDVVECELRVEGVRLG